MELTKLKYFYLSAKLEHITKAAEELKIAQPALTKAIKSLEDELGVKLFMRKGRNVYLTEYGEYLKNKLETVFPIFDNLPAEIRSLSNVVNNKIKVKVLAASSIVTDIVISFKKDYPDTIFQLVQNEDEKGCDITITTGSATIDYTDGKEYCVMEERIFLAVPKDSTYAKMDSVNLAEVSKEGFVSLAGSRKFRALCDNFCNQAGFIPHTVFESDSPAAVKNLIGANVGIGFWPEYSWGKLMTNDVVLVPIADPVCHRDIVVRYHKAETHSDITKTFYDYVKAYLKNR